MSVRVRDLLTAELHQLRHEPIQKRIRARLGEDTVVDSTRAMLVWEPKRVVPSYAVPSEDIDGEIIAAADSDQPLPEGVPAMGAPQLQGRPVFDPSVPFSAHTADGEPVLIRGSSSTREAAGFRLADDVLSGYVILDFDAFDEWYEEDERNVGHARDPFHRIDIVRSSRHVRVELSGQVLAESSDTYMLFEPPIPVRYYFRRGDVAMDQLRPSSKKTFCAYKGQASYWSADEADDIVWTYKDPLREAAEVKDRLAFFNERTDIFVDGELLERPVTPWSPRPPG